MTQPPLTTSPSTQTDNPPHANESALVGNHDIERIMVIRESDDDLLLLEGLMDQTYRTFQDRPGVTEARILGLTPYTDPDGVPGVRVHKVPQHRAVSFTRAGTLFLIWGGSARKENAAGLNAFVEQLATYIDRFKPTELLVTTFSRLVRSQSHQGRLRGALVRAGTIVCAGSQRIEMRNNGGRLTWDVLSMVSSVERDDIERRLMLGGLFAARRGQWMLSESAVLHGYELVDDGAGNRVVSLTNDGEEIARVRRMITVLASHGTGREKIRRLQGLGLRRIRNALGGTEVLDVKDFSDSSSLITTLNGHRDIYRTGTYRYRRTISDEYGDGDVAGYPIKHHDGGTKYVEVEMPLGLPQQGWATEAIFDAWDAEVARLASKSSGPLRGAMRKPLSGVCAFTEGDKEYALTSDGRHRYLLRQRSVDPERKTPGWDSSKGSSTIVARFHAQQLHTSIADAVRRALTEGSSFELMDAATAVDDEGHAHVVYIDEATRRASYLARQDRLRRDLERTAQLAVTTTNDLLQQHYAEQAETLAQQLSDTVKALEAKQVPRQIPNHFTVHGRTLLTALDNLANAEGSLDADVADAVATVFRQMRFTLDDNTATWNLDVHLPTNQGVAILRQVSGTVPRNTGDYRYRSNPEEDTVVRGIIEHLKHGRSVDDILKLADTYRVVLTIGRVTTALNTTGITAVQRRWILQHPVPAVRQLIVLQALGENVPPGMDAGWVTHVKNKIATSSHGTHFNRRGSNAPRRQELFDLLAAAGGTMNFDDLARNAGRRRNIVAADLELAYDPKRAPRLRAGWRRSPWVDRRAMTVSLKTCPTCAHKDWVVMMLPDAYGLLCRSCLRLDGVQYPASYATWQEQSGLGTALFMRGRKQPVWLDTVPDGQFTIREWSHVFGLSLSATHGRRDRLVTDGFIEEIGPDPRHRGPGMVPRLYQKTDQFPTRSQEDAA